LVGGLLLIVWTIISYAWMHVKFFGVPNFAAGTAKGRAEIQYTVTNLLVIGMGAAFIYLGLKLRRSRITT
jgi:hypothetical protein